MSVHFSFGKILPGIVLILLLGLSAQSLAQGEAREDRIVMRDGREYRGDILRQVPDSVVVLEMVGGSQLVLPQGEIAEIHRSPHRFRRIRYTLNTYRKPVFVHSRGLAHNVSMQYYPRRSDFGGIALGAGLYYRAVYRLSYRWGIGLGLGAESYEGGGLLPVTAEVSGDLLPSRFTPHYFAQAGYSFSLGPSWRNSAFEGGLTGQVGLGLKVRSRKRFEWVMAVTYRIQPVTETTGGWWWGGPNQPEPGTIERTYRGIGFQLGVWF